MKAIFTSENKEDFRKHNDYVRKQMKSDGDFKFIYDYIHNSIRIAIFAG